MDTTQVLVRPARAHPWLALAAATTGGVMVGLDGTAITIAAPYIARSAHATLPQLEIIANAYLVALALGLLPAGRVADRFGRRATFIAGVLAFGISSLAIAFSDTVPALAVFRAIQGLAGALLQPAALALLRTNFDEHRQGLAVGLWSGFNALAIGVGPVIAGAIVEYLQWEAVFAINLPIGVAAALACRFAVTESRAPDSRVLSALRTLLSQRGVVVPGCVIAVSSFGIFGLLFMLTLYLQNVRGFEPITAGLWLLAPTAIVIVSALVGGALGDRFGPRWPMVAGLVVAAVGTFGVGQAGVDTGYGPLVVPALAVGIGTGLCVVPATNALLAAAGEPLAGMASAVQQAASQFGGLIGIAVLGTVLSASVSAALPAQAVDPDAVAQGRVSAGIAPEVGHAVFVHGMGTALTVAAVITVVSAAATGVFARR